MRIARVMLASVLLVGVCWIGLSLQEAEAQKKGKKRAASTSYLMRGLVKPPHVALTKLLREGPADEKEWDAVACQVACLNELSYTLMADGRCPDDTWKSACLKSLRGGTDAAMAAAKKKDLEATREALKTITKSCVDCHAAFKS